MALYGLAGFVIEGTALRHALRNGQYVDARMVARNIAAPVNRAAAAALDNE